MKSKATEQFFGLSFGVSPSLTKPKVLASAWIFSAVLDPFADCLSHGSEAKKVLCSFRKKNETGKIINLPKIVAHASFREKQTCK